jgi:hypothetical protein
MTVPIGPDPGSTFSNTSAAITNPDSNVNTEYLNIGGTPPPAMKTLVYTPDVRIWIAHGNKQYDVSADIVAVSVSRVENSVSSVVFRLANKPGDANREGAGRYTPLFSPMDRVVVQMKRVEWVQVFSGFLDRVPLVQLYPGTVDFRASCTIKRILHTWWDPGLPDSANLMNQQSAELNEADGSEGVDPGSGLPSQLDKGLGSLLRRVLVNVGNWHPSNIHIQRFPLGYYNFMKQEINRFNGDQAVNDFRRMLLGDDTSGGVGASAGKQVGVNKGGYVLDQMSRKLEVIRAVDEMGMGVSTKDVALGQGISTVPQGSGDHKDKPAWQGQQQLGQNYTDAAMKNDAAVHCFMTVMVESSWNMWANPSVPESYNFPNDGTPPGGGDHLSVGLFQQQPGWGSIDQRMNPRESAGMFLQKLAQMDWRNMDRGTACQAVQRSAFPGRYSTFEQSAIEEVRAIRTGTGAPSGAAGQNNGALPGLGATAVGTAPPPITAGVGGTSVLPAVPTVNGQISPASSTELLGKPQFDLAKAISYGMSRIGTPYIYGAPGPANFDCSSFTQWCYRSMGLEIGRDTYTQLANGQKISMAQAQPGDLLQPASGEHVVMWLGNGQILHAPQSGDVVKIAPLYFTPAHVLHFPPATYGGTYPVPFDIPTGPGAVPGTVAQGANGGTAAVSPSEGIARNLFSWMFEPGKFMNATSMLFGSGGEGGTSPEAAFMNDESLIHTVVSLTKAGLRNFQSLPNGDFCAYYPDYFGLDGKQAVMDLEDIEMKDVKIDLNDDALATHVYVAGTQDPRGASDGIQGWLRTKGIATVENATLFRRMAAAAPQVRGSEMTMMDGKELMRRFGVRPLTQQMGNIQSGTMEFLLALQIFMTKWAEQYSTQIELTFMPELYPGMRINLKNHNLQVYVTAVTHSGDFENGFTTSATIMAPSTPNIARIASQVNDNLWNKGWDQRDVNGNVMNMQWMHPGGAA